MSWVYDFAALCGLSMVGVGAGFQWGWPAGLAASGALLTVLAMVSARAR